MSILDIDADSVGKLQHPASQKVLRFGQYVILCFNLVASHGASCNIGLKVLNVTSQGVGNQKGYTKVRIATMCLTPLLSYSRMFKKCKRVVAG